MSLRFFFSVEVGAVWSARSLRGTYTPGLALFIGAGLYLYTKRAPFTKARAFPLLPREQGKEEKREKSTERKREYPCNLMSE